MIVEEIILALIVSILLNLVLFLPAFFLKTDKLTDGSYAITFVLVTLILFLRAEMSINRILVALMIFLWALRLGTYLIIRINKTKKDNRFDEFRHKFWSFLGFWILQGITVFFVLIPTIFYFKSPSSKIYIIGLFVWFIGLIIETISDIQKFRFISDKNNRSKWIESGLWHYSRHPNYFGEILCWLGVWITVLPALSLWLRIISIIGPLFIAVMLIFISGIPILEKKAKEKWGHDHRYEDYVRRTSMLLLWPVKENKIHKNKKVRK
jgi:steroid 5-alpha reductase family enzyme